MPRSESSKSSAQGSCSKDKARELGQNLAAPAHRGGRDEVGTGPRDSLKAGALLVLERKGFR